jgi:hypothetical protein
VRVWRFPGCARVCPLSLWERAGVRVYQCRIRDRLDLEDHQRRRRRRLHLGRSLGGNDRSLGRSSGSLGQDGEQNPGLPLIPLGEVAANALGDIREVPVREFPEEEVDVGELLLEDFARAREHGLAARGARQTPEPFLPAGRAIHVG